VCFIDGDFTAQTSGGQSHAERHRTRIVVLVYDGFVEPHMYGTKESIPVEDPAAMLPRLGVSNGTTLTVTLVVNGAVVATLHFGNPEPYGSFVAAHGLHGVAPVEEIRPTALFEFLLARRATGRGIRAVPLSQARRPLMEELRSGGIAVLVADRNIAGRVHPTTFFGATTHLPTGPASLALTSGRPLLVAACRRVGPERFTARAWLIEPELSGDRRADAAALTEAMARRMEEAIAEAPEQWFAAFQPIWDEEVGSRG